MRPPPYPKKINPKEKIYYYFKINAATYALFDSDISTPVAYGSVAFVGATISNLPMSSTIFYFEIDSRLGWRMKRSYNPKKEEVSEEDKKADVEKAKAEKENSQKKQR